MTSQASDFRMLGIVLASVVCLIGSIGNLLAIVVYMNNRKLKTAFNLLIVNLAVIDFIISTTILPIILYGYITMSWPLNSTSCEVFAYFYYAAHFTSVINLLMITLNRYMHVTQPHATYKIIYSAKRRRIFALVAWSISPICLLPLLFTGGFSWWENGYMCAYSRQNGFPNVYSLILRVVFQIVPLVVMVVLYTLIFKTVKRSHSNIDNPKIQVDECESYYSTDTRGVNSVSQPSPSFRSDPYQLRLSYETSPSRSPRSYMRERSLVKTVSTDTLASPAWRDPRKETELRHFQEQFRLPSSFTNSPATKGVENTSDELAVLPQQTTVPRQAKLCRSVTAENMFEKSTNTNSNASANKHSDFTTKHRSVTFCSFDLIKSRLPPETLNENEVQFSVSNSSVCITRSSRQNRAIERQRPQTLNISGVIKTRGFAKDKLNSISPALAKWATAENVPNARKSLRRFSIALGITPSPPNNQAPVVKRRKSIQHAKAQRQLLYMSITICVAFAVCALPSVIMNLVATYEGIPAVFHMLGSNLGWLNSLINPIVYAAMNAQFQKAYSRLFTRILNWLRCHRRVGPINATR